MKCKFFNLIEVTLAIAVVGIGIAGIMSVFPVALNASRDAIGNNYAPEIGDQFLSFIAMKANNEQDWGNAASFVYKLPSDTIPSTASDGTFNVAPVTTGSGRIYESTVANSGIYKVEQGAAGGIVDFSAIVRVWKTQIKGIYVSGNSGDVPYKYAACIHVEVSWPLELPYTVRQKKYYALEIYNSNPSP